jgi:hypothetical protein
MRQCPGPAMCPFAGGKRFYVLVGLVAFLILAMTGVAVAAILKGKDGVITSATCGAMTAAVTGVLVGGVRLHRKSDKEV